jgi:hypothetical protein
MRRNSWRLLVEGLRDALRVTSNEEEVKSKSKKGNYASRVFPIEEDIPQVRYSFLKNERRNEYKGLEGMRNKYKLSCSR